MSVLPEAKLAREAEICYAMVCMATDYDCWKTDHADVTVDMVVQNLNANSAHAKALILEVVPALSKDAECSCHTAMRGAIMTAPSKRNPETMAKLRTILPELEL
jgi:5'-methylthioadenosine phosphorylase